MKTTMESFKRMLDDMNYDGNRTYCQIENPDSWVLDGNTAYLPLEGWTLTDLSMYILPFIDEEKAYFTKNKLVVNLF